MILVWSRRAIAESSRTRRGRRESKDPVNHWLLPKFGNLYSLQLPCDLQQFFFFIGYGYANVSLLCFPLVTVHVHVLLVPHCLLAKHTYCVFPGRHFHGRTCLPPFTEFNHVHRSKWYSDNHFVDINFGRMKLSTTSADTTTPAGHDDIPVINLIISMYFLLARVLFIFFFF